MNREEHLASKQYQNDSWRLIPNQVARDAETNSVVNYESSTSETAQKLSDMENNVLAEKRQKFSPSHASLDNSDALSKNFGANDFSSTTSCRRYN